MAINPGTKYPGKVAPPTAGYPFSSARNVSTPGDGTGTPFEAALVNDLFGFQQALLSEVGATPSGTPDQVGASQYLDAIKGIILDTPDPTVLGLIASTVVHPAGTVLTLVGFAASKDGPKADWELNGVTGQPTSQSPEQLDAALINDGNGDQWAILGDVLNGESIGIGFSGNDSVLMKVAFDHVENANKSFIQHKLVNLTTSVQVGLVTGDAIYSRVYIANTTCAAGAGYILGSATSYIKRSSFAFGRVSGTGKIAANVDCVTLVAFAQSFLEINDAVDAKNCILITPAQACGDNQAKLGRVGGCVNGVHMDNTVNLGGGHAQNFRCEFGLILTCDYGIRKTIDLAGSPMDLSYFKGALDFNVINDVLDNQPDSKSTYELMFSDDADVFVTKSLDGIGIETSYLIKHFRGVGNRGMFIGIGNEKAGLIKYGLMRASGLIADAPQLVVNSEDNAPGSDTIIQLTHSDADGLSNISLGGFVQSNFISVNEAEMFVGAQHNAARLAVARAIAASGTGSWAPAVGDVSLLGTNALRWSDLHLSGKVLIGGNQILTTQRTAVADATDAASAITQLNILLTKLREHGLIAT